MLCLTIGVSSLTYSATEAEKTLYRHEQWSIGRVSNLNRQWNISTGLPQISVKAITKDTQDMIWVGTENGLARFDGRKFEIFNGQNTAALPSTWIDALFTDSKGRIWIATADGIVRGEGHQFTPIINSSASTRTKHLAETQDGTLWVGGSRLWWITGDTLQPAPFHSEPVDFLAAAGKTLWLVAKDQTLSVFTNGELQSLRAPMLRDQQVTKMVTLDDRAYLLANGQVWVAQLSPTNAIQLQPLPMAPASGLSLVSTQQQSLMMLAIDGNAYEIRPTQDPTWRRVHFGAKLPVDDGEIVLLADERQIWIGTTQGGLHTFWPTSVRREAAETEFGAARVWSFFADESVYAATDDGVFKRLDGSNWVPVVTTHDLNGNIAYSYLKSNGIEWIGSRKGLYTRTISNPSDAVAASSKPMLQSAVGDRQINTLVEIGEQIWVGTNRGLFHHHANTMEFTPIASLEDQAIRAIHQDHQGGLWVGAEAGLFHLSPNTKPTSPWQAVNLPITSSVFATSIVELPSGELIVASYGDGLLLRQQDGTWQQFTVSDGLPFQNLFNLVLENNELWISSGSGLFKLPIPRLLRGEVEADVVIRDDGAFPNRDRLRCCNGAGNRRSIMLDGRLFLPTLEGVLSVPITQSAEPTPSAIISAVFSDNERLSWGAELLLPKTTRDINIAFTTPTFGNENLIEYRYRLMPSHEEWTYPMGQQMAYFTNLPPGLSRFELQSRSSSSEWSTGPELAIIAEPRFTETVMAKVLLVLTAVLMGWLLVRWRTHQLKQQSLLLEQQVAERTADFERVNAELTAVNQELKLAAITDSLTGLRNRRFLQEQLTTLLSGINRRLRDNEAPSVCAVMIMDIDHFKQVNDTFGHDRGDQVLVATARALEKAARGEDYLLRWGGEEFVLVIPDIDPKYVEKVHERIHQAVAPIGDETQLGRPITLSIGIVLLPWLEERVDQREWEHSLELADLGLYAVKSNGRNGSAMIATTPAMTEHEDWTPEGLELARLEQKWSYELWPGQAQKLD